MIVSLFDWGWGSHYVAVYVIFCSLSTNVAVKFKKCNLEFFYFLLANNIFSIFSPILQIANLDTSQKLKKKTIFDKAGHFHLFGAHYGSLRETPKPLFFDDDGKSLKEQLTPN